MMIKLTVLFVIYFIQVFFTTKVDNAVISGYLGYSGYQQKPPVNDIPISIQWRILGFARDVNCPYSQDGCPDAGSGTFQAWWDTTTYSPNVISADKEPIYFISLFGDVVKNFVLTVDQQTWINNAVQSLSNLIDAYFIRGIDINLENGLNQQFVDCMTQVVTTLRQKKDVGIIISLTPFYRTWSWYQTLYSNIQQYQPVINYQAYAELGTSATANDAVTLYKSLSQNSGILLSSFMFMIDTNQQPPRGIQGNAAVQAYQQLRQQIPPIRGLSVFGLDDDWNNTRNFNTEQSFITSVTTKSFQNAQTGLCLDSSASDAVYTGPYNGGLFQKWNIINIPNGYVNLENAITGLYLDSSTNAYVGPANGGNYQKWKFDGLRIVDVATNRALDSNYAGSVYTGPENGGNYQNWNQI